MIQGLLLEEGSRACASAAGGFDVPDFLAAGPRDVFVAGSGARGARATLLGGRRARAAGLPISPALGRGDRARR